MAWATWNPSDKDTNITLSGGNLVVNHGGAGGHECVRATIQLSGKMYFEVAYTAYGSEDCYIGVCGTAAASRTGWEYLGGNGDEWTISEDGWKVHNNNSASILSAYNLNDVVQVAVDIDAGKIWFGRNGTWSGDPAAGTGEAYSGLTGNLYPAMSIDSDFTKTANFGASAWSHGPPSGFKGVTDSLTPAAEGWSWTGQQADINKRTLRPAAAAWSWAAQAAKLPRVIRPAATLIQWTGHMAKVNAVTLEPAAATWSWTGHTPLIARYGDFNGATAVLTYQFFEMVEGTFAGGVQPPEYSLSDAPQGALPMATLAPSLTLDCFTGEVGTFTSGPLVPGLSFERAPDINAGAAAPSFSLEVVVGEVGTVQGGTLEPTLNLADGRDRTGTIPMGTRAPRVRLVGATGETGSLAGRVIPLRPRLVGQTGAAGTFLGATKTSAFSFTGVAWETGVFAASTGKPLFRMVGFAPDAGTAVAYAMNLEHPGVTQYTNYPFMALGEVNGEFLGVDTSGVVRLSGADDEGTDIPWLTRFGFSDFAGVGGMDAELVKRLVDLYVGYRADADITVKIRIDREGTATTYTLTKHPSSDRLQTRRAKLARGLKSRYWQVEIGATEGDAEIESLGLLVRPLTRKIA